MKKKSFLNKNWKFLLILLIIIGGFGVLGYLLYGAGVIQNIFNVIDQDQFNNPPEGNHRCYIEFEDKEICAGDEAVAHLSDGADSMCRVAFKYNPYDIESIWNLYGDYTLNANGELTLVNTPEIPGDYLVRMICLDNEGNLCSDDDLLSVRDCGDEEDSGDSSSDSSSSDCQGKIYTPECSFFTNEIICEGHFMTINSNNYECEWVVKLQSTTCEPSLREC